MGNDWFHEYFINELKAIGRKPTSNMKYEVVDSLPSSGNEQTIYFVKNDSSSSNNHYDEYVWISSSSTFEKIGSSQIDGSAANPDWNQNDATQPDYVKNRPFYTGDPVETVHVEETTVAFADIGHGLYGAEFETTFVATVGETYKVSWDGAAHECTCEVFNDLPVIGNLSIAGEGADSGEPFVMGGFNGRGAGIYTADTSASHTFSISGRTIPVVKIDEKYLPDTVATKSDVEVVESTANNAQSTANAAKTTANNAQSTANAAKTTADNAQSTANNAQTTADNAQTTADNAVKYSSSQHLTDEQKQLARINIGAGTSSFSGNYNNLTNKPLSLNGLIQSNTGTTKIDVLDYTTNGDIIICQTQYIFDTSSSIFKRLLNTRVIGYRDKGYTVIYDKNLNAGWAFFDNVKINDIVYYGVGIGENVETLKDRYLFISNGGFIIIRNSNISMEKPIRYFKIEYAGVSQSIPIAYLSETFIPPAIQRVGDDLILSSSTEGSTKKFKITVDDTGTISATEVT